MGGGTGTEWSMCTSRRASAQSTSGLPTLAPTSFVSVVCDRLTERERESRPIECIIGCDDGHDGGDAASGDEAARPARWGRHRTESGCATRR